MTYLEKVYLQHSVLFHQSRAHGGVAGETPPKLKLWGFAVGQPGELQAWHPLTAARTSFRGCTLLRWPSGSLLCMTIWNTQKATQHEFLELSLPFFFVAYRRVYEGKYVYWKNKPCHLIMFSGLQWVMWTYIPLNNAAVYLSKQRCTL